MAFVGAFWDALIGQQRNPVAFLRSMRRYHRRLWWPAWGIRAIIWATSLITLRIVAWLTHTDWKPMLAPVFLLPLVAQMLCSVPIILLGEAQFWFLYAYSPLLILTAWLWGLGSLLPLGTALGLQIGFNFFVGKLLTDGCAMWVHQRLEKARDEQQRRRGDYLPTASLAMALWWRTRRIRLWAALILGGVIIFCYHALPAQSLFGYRALGEGVRLLHAAISVSAGVAGCLGLDATLLAILMGIPPVRFTDQQWQATYSGRAALWLPAQHIRRLCTPEHPLFDQSRAICLLLTQGCLGPVVRRACSASSLMHLQQLLLSLSLQEGGGAAIRYLRPILPLPLQPVGLFYASLADEAAKPLDLQRWIHVLTTQFPTTVQYDGFEASTILILSQVRDALLTVKVTPAITQVLQGLRQLSAESHFTLPSPGTTPAMAWPFMLLWHLEQRQERLQTL